MVTPYLQAEDTRTRIEIPFPVILRGIDTLGDRFEQHGVLDELSPQMLCMRIRRSVLPGSRLLACVSFSLAPTEEAARMRVAMRGTVASCEPIGSGYWQVIITVHRHRFLYADAT